MYKYQERLVSYLLCRYKGIYNGSLNKENKDISFGFAILIFEIGLK